MFYRLNLFLTVFILTGCVRSCNPPSRGEMTPKQVLEAYLEAAFNIEDVDQREILLQFVTGPLKASLSSATDETIEDLYISPRYYLKNLYVAEAEYHTPSECEVRYNLSYREELGPKEQDQGLRELVIKAESAVSLKKEEGVWYIEGVLNKKAKINFPVFHIKAKSDS